MFLLKERELPQTKGLSSFSSDLSPVEQQALSELALHIKSVSGIDIKEDKNFLILTRLQKRLETLQCNLVEYAQKVIQEPEECQICVELLTTHKTDWFREIVHFKWLKDLIHKRDPRRPLQIWSAASSTGLEAYSILFVCLREGLSHDQFRILGTDISRPILETALSQPSTHDFQKQLETLLQKVPDPEKTLRECELAIKSSMKFREFNLMDDIFPVPVKFDVIFLRNVLIYFDRPTVMKVCRSLMRHLRPEGHLILGLSESIQGEIPELKAIGNSIYQYQKAVSNAA